MKKNLNLLLTFALQLLVMVPAIAREDVNKPKGTPAPPSGGRVGATSNFNCLTPVANAELNINNVRALILNGGDMWWDAVNGVSVGRYEIPKVTDPSGIRRSSMFAGGIWIGGRDNLSGDLLVTAQTYRQGGQRSYWPGPIDSVTAATSAARCNAWDQFFPCLKTTVLQYITDFQAGLITDESQIPDEIKYWPGRRNPFLPRKPGKPISSADLDFSIARFVDVNRDGIYDPRAGDYPQLPGDDGTSVRDVINAADQTLFYITNDIGGAKQFSNNQPGVAIGMEVQTEAFAYVTSDPRNDMTFYRNRLVNKGNRTISECFFGQWVDPDLGYYADDYVGCDVPRGLGICYNGNDVDPTLLGYGPNPPSIAVDFFIGPRADPNDGVDNNKNGIIDEPNEPIIMSDFMYYNNDGDPKNGNPNSASDYYNYLRMIWRDGSRVSYDGRAGTTPVGNPGPSGSGIAVVGPSTFIFPDGTDQEICWGSGGTVARPCPTGRLPVWNERSAGNPPGDRRFLSSAGPFTLRPGAINELTIGVVWARATSGGATGSFNQLLLADDMAQRLFDRNFKILLGPQEPQVKVTELDQQIVLTIIPDTFQGVGTEDYTIRDNSLNPIFGSDEYKFQGYKVYQLADDRVSTGELDNPDRAILIAQSDIKDGVGRILNREFDPVSGELVPKVKVEGADRGIRNTINVEFDAFTQRRLINYQKYYFRVITYAYNANSRNVEPYLQGFPIPSRGTGTVFGQPRKITTVNFGTEVRSNIGQRFDIVKQYGMGNGGNQLDTIPRAAELEIVRKGKLEVEKMRFTAGNAPLTIKVYDPTLVKDAEFEVKLSSRLRVRRAPGAIRNYQAGDTIFANLRPIIRSGCDSRNRPTGVTPETELLCPGTLTNTTAQVPGIAVINRVIPVGGREFDLDVDIVNDFQGGRFTWFIENFFIPDDPQGNPQFENYKEIKREFKRRGDADFIDTCISQVYGDFWRLRDIKTAPNQYIYSRRLISDAGEQIIPQYGISLEITRVDNPHYAVQLNPTNGFQTADITHRNLLKPWLGGLPTVNGNKYIAYAPSAVSTIDPSNVMTNILGGRIGPFSAATPVTSGGPGYFVTADNAIPNNLRALGNIDIVYTPDTSLWTKVVVLQEAADTIEYIPNRPAFPPGRRMVKSRRPSVDKNLRPTGATSPFRNQASRGVSWFPGYAIDLDRGIRLNMMFSESASAPWGPGRGNDLRYEIPLEIIQGIGSANGNFVYIVNQPYDEARQLEYAFDSVTASFRLQLQSGTYNQNMAQIFNNVSWVGMPAVSAFSLPRNLRDPLGVAITPQNVQEQTMPFSNEARMRIRMNKAFGGEIARENGTNVYKPATFTLSTAGKSMVTGNRELAKKALDMIRVVPNPYYAYSQHEGNDNDNRVLITNLPSRCRVSIFTLSGNLIWSRNVDFTGQSGNNIVNHIEWPLTNEDGLPIAGGAYLIHIDGYDLGQTVVKWFGILRPIDLTNISQN